MALTHLVLTGLFNCPGPWVTWIRGVCFARPLEALCASDAIVLIGSVSGLLQTGSSFVLVCGKVLDDHIDHIVEDVGTDIIP